MIDLRHALRVLAFGCLALGSLLLLGAMVAAIALRNSPTETIFNVEVQTERLDIDVASVLPFQWPLRNVELVEGTGDPLTLSKPISFTGSLRIDPPSKVQIERVAFGPVVIDVESKTGESVGQWYENDEPLRRAGRVVRVRIANLPQRARDGDRVLLPLSGNVTTGRSIGSETGATTSLLRSGKVTMLARPILGGEMFQAESIELDAGDYFAIPRGADREKPEDALGFVVADERPALTAAYRVVGRLGEVTRPGGGQFTVVAPLSSLFLRDSLLQGLVRVIITIGAIGGFVSSVLQGLEAYRAGMERRSGGRVV